MGFGSRSVEVVVSAGSLDPGLWVGREVLLTGHTGFKGSWLAHWLHLWGARVHGLALDPQSPGGLFVAAGVDAAVAEDRRGDIRDADAVREAVEAARPSVVFHLAAQPLVRESYRDPLATWATNVMGTAHVLDAARECGSVEAVVVVTTDKVYAHASSGRAFMESDRLGAADPYSSSKAAAELVTASYAESFLRGRGVAVTTARAGNVIGGGDWATDRLVPDLVRAVRAGEPVVVRHPGATRPWQHVLEPLAGYLLLAERLLQAPETVPSALNFGPSPDDFATVANLIALVTELTGHHLEVRVAIDPGLPEAAELTLDSSLAGHVLGWFPRWSLREAVAATVAWYEAEAAGADMAAFTRRQISEFIGAARGDV